MRIVAANHADSLRRNLSDDRNAIRVVDSVTDELRIHYESATNDVPAEILALAMRLDGHMAQPTFAG
jgi:hypothetical protein